MDLPKTYYPAETEKKWYDVWEKAGYFKPARGASPSPLNFCIVIPPPNVTGSLHMGHALNNTLQDILVRWRRMQGYRTLWVPGTDHGGIATQNVVERLLQKEKTSRHDLGREKFLARMWQWRKESGDTILLQLRRLGASCDWSRTRFTMDEVFSLAVRTAFVQLFQKGLIYKGPRMVNWCPKDQTALSDIEVEHEPQAGKLWYIRYPLADGAGTSNPVVVATTRPETMLGDTAVAVNPEDKRYKSLVGKKLLLPLMNRQIPVVADAAVDPAFGTGAVKVTPAHDPTDFEIAERHKLPHEVVIDFNGKMTPRAGKYAGLDRFQARKKVLEDLEAQGLLEKTEDYQLSAAVCYRCQTIVEPLVSEQWFLKMKLMAERAAEATRNGQVKIVPASWEKPYLLWLDNIHDWCISRQIWWGHQIPVYYCPKSCKPVAAVEKPARCPTCGATHLTQDEDVLDTWFSSGLWPLGVLGWPNQTEDLKTFYPTSVLVTGHEILYLWVARMVMLGLQFKDEVPYHHVFIHGIVRDKSGKKMSKSLGNVIDPLVIMEQYGTDALRFSLAESSVPGRDMQLSNDSFLKARNFANKLWNASRFVLMNLEGYTPRPMPPREKLALADRWILAELQAAIGQITEALDDFNPAMASRILYEFVWSSFCDWYVEIAKIRLTGDDPQAKSIAQTVLVHVLEQILALLHPMMPYETEEIYQALRAFVRNPSESIMIHPWPIADKTGYYDGEACHKMGALQQVVTAIRTLRSEMNVTPGKPITCLVKTSEEPWITDFKDAEWASIIKTLARAPSMTVGAEVNRPPSSAVAVFNGGEIYVPLEDMAKEKARLEKNLAHLKDAIGRDMQMLSNPDFKQRAAQEEVQRVADRWNQNSKKAALLERNLQGL